MNKSRLLLFVYRIFLPYIDLSKVVASLRGFPFFLRDLVRYMFKSKKCLLNLDLYPILDDRTKNTGVDYHYLYQQIWVFNSVNKLRPKDHYDVSSTYQMSCYLAGITNAHFIDLRPIKADIPNLDLLEGDIENLPFKDNSLESVSCLHVIEHIGLGRYGDRLDINGPEVAARELSRVVKPNGVLYLSTPIGRERVCFNAHHVFNPFTILKYFKDFELIQFNMVDDEGKLHRDIEVKDFKKNEYSLGMFMLRKK